jgi:uncharacterized protein YbjT (DUF2867 family)
MILVTGATGTVGSALVNALLTRGEQVTAVTRDPARIEPRPGLTVATEIGPADAIFLLAPPGPGIPALDHAMLEAATVAGIPRLVKLSAIGTPSRRTANDRPGIGSWHQPGEIAVADCGRSWTILRPTSFASNTMAWIPDIRAGRPIPNLFGTGRQGVIAPADVAQVAAEVLTGPGHEGRTYTLTGPTLLTVPDQAAVLSAVLAVPITTRDVPPAEARSSFPPELAEVALAGVALVREGGNAVLTPDVADLLGRPPTSFRAWAEAVDWV